MRRWRGCLPVSALPTNSLVSRAKPQQGLVLPRFAQCGTVVVPRTTPRPAGRAGQQQDCAQSTCSEHHFIVRERVAIPGIQVLLARFSGQFFAGALECRELAIRPRPGVPGLDQDAKQEGVLQEDLQPAIHGFPQETLGIRDFGGGQYPAGHPAR